MPSSTFKFPLFLLLVLFLFGSASGCKVFGNDLRDDEGFLRCQALVVPEDMRCIPGGPFVRGSDRWTIDEDSKRRIQDEAPESRVTVSTFLMDTFEVTASDYDACVQAGGCAYAKTNYANYSRPKMPKLGVSWYHARDFCKWRGKRLPTESEWEKAARGPDGDLYPWGNTDPDCTKAIIKENGQRGCGIAGGTTWDVGSLPPRRYGLYDIAGNTWEWVQDWYSPSYAKCGPDCFGLDPAGPCKGADRCPGHAHKIVRGGSWWWEAEFTLGHNRRPHFATNQPYHHFGFRCAMSPAPGSSRTSG